MTVEIPFYEQGGRTFIDDEDLEAGPTISVLFARPFKRGVNVVHVNSSPGILVALMSDSVTLAGFDVWVNPPDNPERRYWFAFSAVGS